MDLDTYYENAELKLNYNWEEAELKLIETELWYKGNNCF